MKNILHVTSEIPDNNSGGKIVVKESIVALTKKNEVDYMGPEIKNKLNDYLKLKNKYILKEEKSKIKRIKSIITLNLSTYYNSFKIVEKDIPWEKYDYIYLEFSKWSFITNYAKKKNKKVIIRLHNIEKEYSYNLYKLNKNLINYFKYLYYCFNEKRAIKNSNCILVLTEKDKEKIKEIYKKEIKNKKIIVMPVCIKEGEKNKKRKIDGELIILITGSLWFGPNLDGILWFIDNVWNEVLKKCKLIIAGSNPSIELIEKIRKCDNIELIKNPIDMKPYFMKTDIYVSPIFTGAGMKVKNAEAMSYGLPIIGTRHSFIGYEKFLNLHYIANNKDEFIEAINKFIDMKNEELNILKQKVINAFNSNYDLKNAHKYLDSILNNEEI